MLIIATRVPLVVNIIVQRLDINGALVWYSVIMLCTIRFYVIIKDLAKKNIRSTLVLSEFPSSGANGKPSGSSNRNILQPTYIGVFGMANQEVSKEEYTLMATITQENKLLLLISSLSVPTSCSKTISSKN
ncbi:hypothetical protein Lal_00012755 [Lupinus albus]|nr:hypothetical protein Lal_00012755 [Lupinus albus]